MLLVNLPHRAPNFAQLLLLQVSLSPATTRLSHAANRLSLHGTLAERAGNLRTFLPALPSLHHPSRYPPLLRYAGLPIARYDLKQDLSISPSIYLVSSDMALKLELSIYLSPLLPPTHNTLPCLPPQRLLRIKGNPLFPHRLRPV